MSQDRMVPSHVKGVEFRDIRSRTIEGYLNIRQLADEIGAWPSTFRNWYWKGLMKPDFYTRSGVFFAKSRTEEIKQLWADRLHSSPGSAPVRGVITSFGVMVPRVKPVKEVLERLALTRLKKPIRRSYSKTRKHYNLKDLML